jgi:hypothetical protein
MYQGYKIWTWGGEEGRRSRVRRKPFSASIFSFFQFCRRMASCSHFDPIALNNSDTEAATSFRVNNNKPESKTLFRE